MTHNPTYGEVLNQSTEDKELKRDVSNLAGDGGYGRTDEKH